jgi:hypothetical protein
MDGNAATDGHGTMERNAATDDTDGHETTERNAATDDTDGHR